jgi:plastocyanin
MYRGAHDRPFPKEPDMSTSREVRYATIYVFPSTDKRTKVRVSASPETLTVCAGDIVDWTVVDATGGQARVEIRWKERTPLKEEPKPFPRTARARVRRKVEPGKYRYSIFIDGVEMFDPEIEIMS